MTQRKCGTCRYFEEGGIAASGWCRHPERQELQHMVLVRKTELACRDGWDHDLWEPKDGGGNGGGGSGGSRQQRASGRRTAGESPVLTPTGGAPNGRSDMAAHSSTGSGSGSSGGSGQAVRTLNPDETESADQSGPAREPDRYSFEDASTIFNPSRNAEQNEQVDEIREETFSTRGMRTARASFEPVQAEASPEPLKSSQDETHPQSREKLNPLNGHEGGAPGRFGAPSQGMPGNDQRNPWSSEGAAYEPEPVEQSGMTEPFDVMEPETDMPESTADSYEDPAEPGIADEAEGHSGEWAPEVGDDGSRGALNIPLSLQREQCCRTCRDFRPADGGHRGWCNNPFAFEHRQEVRADDLACQGTFGNWWSPTDDWWVERGDISHHSTPTPLVNELIRETQEQKAEDPGSTNKRSKS